MDGQGSGHPGIGAVAHARFCFHFIRVVRIQNRVECHVHRREAAGAAQPGTDGRIRDPDGHSHSHPGSAAPGVGTVGRRRHRVGRGGGQGDICIG